MIRFETNSDQYNLYADYYSYYVWKSNHCVFGKAYTDGCWVTKRKRLTHNFLQLQTAAKNMIQLVSGLTKENVNALVNRVNLVNSVISVNKDSVTFWLGANHFSFKRDEPGNNHKVAQLLAEKGFIVMTDKKISAPANPKKTKDFSSHIRQTYVNKGLIEESDVESFAAWFRLNSKSLLGKKVTEVASLFSKFKFLSEAEEVSKEMDDLDRAVERLRSSSPIPIPDVKSQDYFAYLVEAARARAKKASEKFPQPNYVLNKVSEEHGEVIKAVVHYMEGREEWTRVENELIDNLAMLIRLVKEGDQVIGFTPPLEVLNFKG